MAITFVWLKSSVAIKNGKRAGIILFAHKYNPFLAEARLDEENNTSNIVKSTKIILIIVQSTLADTLFQSTETGCFHMTGQVDTTDIGKL